MKDQPLILAIETATRGGGVAVARGEELLAAIAGDASISHSTNLLAMIQEALQSVHAGIAEVDLFAVAVGPGSFTGLRIGLATVKAFATHLRRHVAGVSTLAAVAHASGVNGGVVSLLPAGRGEVFAQMFSVNGKQVTALDEAAHVSPGDVLQKYGVQRDIRWAGEGVEKYDEFVRNRLKSIVELENHTLQLIYPVPPGGAWAPLAPSVASLGLQIQREGKSTTAEDLHAVYVRASDAEINERWQQQRQQQQAGK